MQETEFIWFNGKLIKWKDAKIHVLTHSLHYGGGAFEGIRVYKTKKGSVVFRLKEHIKRFFNSAESLDMKVFFSQEEIINAIKETVRVNKLKEGYIRPIIFHGYGKMGLDPTGCEVNVVIAVWPWPAYIGESAKVKTSSFIRIHPKSLKADKKICGHYVNSILGSLEAKKQGFDESLFLDYEGNVAEGPGENIFMIKDGKIKTPKLKGQILPGITRDSIIKVTKDLGYEVEEEDITLDELKTADELFFVGTAAEVTPISQLDDVFFKEGKIAERIRKKFLEIVHYEDEKYSDWLDFI